MAICSGILGRTPNSRIAPRTSPSRPLPAPWGHRERPRSWAGRPACGGGGSPPPRRTGPCRRAAPRAPSGARRRPAVPHRRSDLASATFRCHDRTHDHHPRRRTRLPGVPPLARRRPGLTDVAAGEVLRVDPATSTAEVVCRVEGHPVGLGFLPDGRRLVAVGATPEIVRRKPTEKWLGACRPLLVGHCDARTTCTSMRGTRPCRQLRRRECSAAASVPGRRRSRRARRDAACRC